MIILDDSGRRCQRRERAVWQPSRRERVPPANASLLRHAPPPLECFFDLSMSKTPTLPGAEAAPIPPETPPFAAPIPRRLMPAFRALRHRNFRLFFAGQLISLLGTVGFVTQIPVFFLATVGGIVADRYAKLRIVIICQSSSMVLAFLLAW